MPNYNSVRNTLFFCVYSHFLQNDTMTHSMWILKQHKKKFLLKVICLDLLKKNTIKINVTSQVKSTPSTKQKEKTRTFSYIGTAWLI